MKFAAGAAADRRGRVDVAALECDACLEATSVCPIFLVELWDFDNWQQVVGRWK
jgi:hypothetical protein